MPSPVISSSIRHSPPRVPARRPAISHTVVILTTHMVRILAYSLACPLSTSPPTMITRTFFNAHSLDHE